MAAYFSIHLVNKQRLMSMRIADYFGADGTSKFFPTPLFTPEALRERVKSSKPFESLTMADLGSFEAHVNAISTCPTDDPMVQLSYEILTYSIGDAVTSIELNELNKQYVTPVIGLYMPEPFKTDLCEWGRGAEFIGYKEQDLNKFVRAFGSFLRHFKHSKLPLHLRGIKDMNGDDGADDEEFQQLLEDREQLETIFNGEPDDPGLKDVYDKMFSDCLKFVKNEVKHGYKDYLFFGFN
jgi:hypothetical protein